MAVPHTFASMSTWVQGSNCKSLVLSPPPDHQGPEVADHRGRDALDRLVHPHLLAGCGSAKKDGGGVQPGGQSAISFHCLRFLLFFPVLLGVFWRGGGMLMRHEWSQLRGSQPGGIRSLGELNVGLSLQR